MNLTFITTGVSHSDVISHFTLAANSNITFELKFLAKTDIFSEFYWLVYRLNCRQIYWNILRKVSNLL